MNNVYINSAGKFLPGKAVLNDEIENYLGFVGHKPSRYKSSVLRSNKIKARYYARTKQDKQTHLNEELATFAIQNAIDKHPGFALKDVQMLSVGTSIPGLLMPGFASMVHARLGGPPMEVSTAAGVCASGMGALKNAYQAIALGQHTAAVASGSELSSAMMKSSRFEKEMELAETRGDIAESFQYFNADFLRWMLSDGAGALVLQCKPNTTALSLRIDWIELTSYAHDYPTCMYMGTRNPGINMSAGDTWLSYPTVREAEKEGLLVVRQDVNLLVDGIMEITTKEFSRVRQKGLLDSERIDHFLPHISSFFFEDKVISALEEAGTPIPREKWFTNLDRVGNVGAASMYLMIEEALYVGVFKPGDQILIGVPESGRFIMSLAHLTCLAPT